MHDHIVAGIHHGDDSLRRDNCSQSFQETSGAYTAGEDNNHR
jgi:hypothetical protein